MSSTAISWGLTVFLVGAGIYIYRPDLLTRATSQAQEAKGVIAESVPKSSNKKSKQKKPASPKVSADEGTPAPSKQSNEGQGSKKRKIISPPIDKTVTANTIGGQQEQIPRNDDGGLSDKDFAKQLAKAQSGTQLQASSKQQASKKERRASKLAVPSSSEPSGFSTEASSTAGRDADDDLTPAESPESRPLNGSTSRAGDVSDMLEPAGAKPTTLRLTDVSNDAAVKKSASKNFEPVMSKKKRNEKQRKEEQRLLREESDRMHEAKKQEQLRKARAAAGTSNEIKANKFASNANAWQSGTSNAVKTAPASGAGPLLDTFEPSLATSTPANGAVHAESATADAQGLKSQVGPNTAAALTASGREGPSATARQEYVSDLSEEDQIKLLKEQENEDAWESVTTKKSKRRGKPDGELTSGASSPVRAPAVASSKPKVNKTPTNTVPKNVDGVNRFGSFQVNAESGLQDAEWEA